MIENTKTNDGGPAFPVPLNQGESYKEHGQADGLTKREYFATKAMAAMLAAPMGKFKHSTFDELVADAYEIASDMLAARTNGGGDE